MNFFLYKASAGSGKTFTLVKEYLKMALKEEDPYSFRHILAITFTNKAASEMKSRVIEVLHQFSMPSGPQKEAEKSLLKAMVEEMGITEEALLGRAKRSLSAILHQYSDFSIGTIDSFMHRVVRTFAFDLKLPINFSVEMDQEVILQLAIDQLLEQVGTNESLTKTLVGFTEHLSDEEKNLSIQQDLFATAKDLLNEQKASIIKRLQYLSIEDFLKIRVDLQQKGSDYERKMEKLGKKGCDLIELNGLTIEDFYYGSKGIGKFFYTVAAFAPGSYLEPNSYQQKALIENIWYTAKIPINKTTVIDGISNQLASICSEIIALQEYSGSEYKLGFLIKNSLFTIALLNEIGRIIDQIRNEQFIVHISEFNRRVAEIVFNEPAPFIFERLGDRYNHFLIDEFQDTSVMQWQNLLPLIQNGLSENAASLIVGDGKQAIYRFRGGDVEQFAQMPEPYPVTLPSIQKERYRLIKAFYTPKTLDTNYRSLPEVIGFNNRFYRYLSSTLLKPQYQPVYAGLEQKFPGEKSGGYIQLEIVSGDLNRNERDEHQLNRTLELVNELISQKGYKPRDIAIITRRNSEGTLIAARLLGAGIPVISGESLLIDSAPEVRFLLAWMRVIIGENEAVNLLHICSYLIQRKLLPFDSIEQLVVSVKMEEPAVFKLIKAAGFDCSPDQLRGFPLLEATYKICSVFHFLIQEHPYLQFFLESIWNISKQKSVDIPVFLEFWEEKRSSVSITLPQDANAIRVMTVHKSKGLQFPVVILPFAYSERSKQVQSWVYDTEILPEGLPAARLPVSKNLKQTAFDSLVEEEENKRSLDMLNLLYVATTRAEDALYIVSGHSGPSGALLPGWEQYLELFAQHEKPEEFSTGICHWGDSAFFNNRKTDDPPQKEPIVTPFDSGEWQQRIRISRQAPRMWELEPTSNQLSEGNLLHTVLAWVIKKKDVPTAISRLNEEGWADAEKCKAIENQIYKFLNHPKIGIWFQDDLKVRTERELLLKDGSIIRPDRVIEADGLMTVVDYKTGLPRKEHQVQVLEYMNALSQLTDKLVHGYLVYIREELHIEEVTAA